MAESDVETILREIRERVLAQQEAADNNIGASDVHATSGNEGNGASNYGSSLEVVHNGDPERVAAENAALINSYLSTTARAWDRLPPVVSNRSGLAASVELWVKRKMKRATRWYVWEQINFNAAVHHALRDMLQVLVAYERETRNLRAKINAEKDQRLAEKDQRLAEKDQRLAEKELRQAEFAKHQAEIVDSLEELRQELFELRAEIGGTRVELETERAHAGADRAEIQARQTATEAQTGELNSQLAQLNSQLADLAKELREGDERLQSEQHVSFKQISLEISEAAVMEDRARRKAQSLLEELTLRIKRLESE